jgi:hypothetical protein
MMLQVGGGGLVNSCRAEEGTQNQMMEWIELPTIYKAEVIRDQTMSNPTTNM